MTKRIAQFSTDEVYAVFRRRRWLFILPMVLVAGACIIGAFLLPRKYESTTTILVQRDEVLNPLVSFSMAVSIASEDRLRALNEIILSQATVETLLDTLRLGTDPASAEDREDLIRSTKKDISIERQGSESFSIGYLDTDPRRALKGVTFLGDHFIETRLRVETQRNEYAVLFYEKKLEEFKNKFEETQNAVITTMRKRITEMPIENRALYSRVQDVDAEIGGLDEKLKIYQTSLTSLRSFPEALWTERGKRDLLELQRSELPFAQELSALVGRYIDYSARYTGKYPEVKKLETQIVELLGRMRISVESEIARQQSQRWDLEKRKNQNIEGLRTSSVAENQDKDKMSNYSIYQNLYDEMKIKLEQARTTRDLAKKATNQFIVIDPPRVPTEPSKPNRLLIILGGFGLGAFLGILSAGIAEITDTRVRTPFDVYVYSKPIIAYLPDGEVNIHA